MDEEHSSTFAGGYRPAAEEARPKFNIDFEQAVIDNPLKKYTPEQLDEISTSFAQYFEFTGLEKLFNKAARCAREPGLAHTIPGLTDEEKLSLKAEDKVTFWGQPKQLKIAILTCCLGAIIQGWNQTGSNGANVGWPKALQPHLHVKPGNQVTPDVWYYSAVNAITYFTAALVGAWLSDPLQEKLFGRRAALFMAALAILASTIGSSFVSTVNQLLGARIVLGVGMGCKASVIPIYSAEISPGRIRGALGVNWQIFDALGIALGFAANLILSNIDHHGLLSNDAWRFQMASACVPTFPFLILVFVCPESPRFLVKNGKYRESYRSLIALREVPLLAARDLFYMHVQLLAETKLLSRSPTVELGPVLNTPASEMPRANTILEDLNNKETYQNEIKKITYWDRILQLATIPRVRRSAVAAFAVMTFYSSTFFEHIGGSSGSSGSGDGSNHPPLLVEGIISSLKAPSSRPLWLSLGIGLANFLFGLPAYWLIEKWGRRALLLFSIPGMAVSLLACGAAFYIEDNDTRLGIAVFFLFIFTIFYSPGVGPVPFAMSSEIFMSVNREVGMSWAVWVNLFFAGVLALCVPPLMAFLGGKDQKERNELQGRILFAFAVLNGVAFALCYFLVPETSGATISKSSGNLEYMSLEELNYIFDTPTSKHAEYQTKIMLPWALNRIIPGRERQPRPDPPYRWAKYQPQDDQMHIQPGGQYGIELSEQIFPDSSSSSSF